MKEEYDDLKDLFQRVKLDRPSVGFEDKLMQRVNKVALRKKRNRRWSGILGISAGVLIMAGMLMFVLRYYKIYPTVDIHALIDAFASDIFVINQNPIILYIAVPLFLLLVCDTLFRKKKWEKDNKR